jgi:hypothetical protein
MEEETLEAGEYAIEYLKRLSRHWRVYAGVEGEQDEVELIGEAQWHFAPRAYLRLNTGHGSPPRPPTGHRMSAWCLRSEDVEPRAITRARPHNFASA